MLVFTSIFWVALKTHTVHAIGPDRINFQGKVVNADGTNVANGAYNFDFILWDDPTAGTNRWQELTKSITVTDGVFQTELGSATALPDFNTYPALYLAVRFNGDAAGYMLPRVHLTSVPYAKNADALGGLSSSAFAQLSSANVFTNNQTITSSSANALTVGPNGLTNPALNIDASTASSATGLNIKSAAAGGGLAVTTISSGTDEALTISAKGTGTITLASGSTGDIQFFSGSYKITSGGALTVASCTGCGGGGGTLQQAYDVGGLITTATAKDIDFVLADSATDSNLDIDIAGGNTVSISRLDGASIDNPGQLLLLENLDTDLTIADGIKITAAAASTVTDGLDVSDGNIDNAINIGANTIVGTTGVIDFTNFDLAGDGSFTWNINSATSGFLDLGSTGDFVIRDGSGGTAFATFANTGGITFAPTTGADFIVNQAAGVNTQITATAAPTVDLVAITNTGQGTITDAVDGLSITFSQGTDVADTTNAGLNIAATTATDDSGDTLNGANITLTNASTAGTQRGLLITNANDAADATTEALISLVNSETAADSVTDYLIITTASTDTTTDAIDVSSAGLFNALNVGANNITGAGYLLTSTASGLTINSTAADLALQTTTSGNITLTGGGAGDVILATDADSNVQITASAGNSAAFTVTNASSQTVVTVDTTGNELELGAASALAGGLVFYNGTNSNTVKLTSGATSTGYTLTFPTAAPSANNYCLQSSTGGTLTWAPCGGSGTTRQVTLVPEFPGATLTGDGTNNTGTMTSDFCSGSARQNLNTGVCTVTTESHNYYSWTANATNDYDVWVRWQVPSDFSTFSSASFNGWRTSTSDAVTVSVYNDSASTCDTASISGTVATWNNTSLGSITSCTPSAGDTLNIRVQLSVGVNAEFARIGEITLTYNRL